MQIQIHLPLSSRGGNRATATRYARLLEELRHTVSIHDQLVDETPEVLIAIHAKKSHETLVQFRARHPLVPIVLVLAGTDIYPDPGEEALDAMRLADRLVVLQDRAREKIPALFHGKTLTIVQSAAPHRSEDSRLPTDHFRICVVGHLRAIKDPLRAAAASRLLPPESRIEILHAGGILEADFLPLLESEQAENPRYHWLGELAPPAARTLIANSRLQVLASHSEGGAQVIGESIMSGTPVLASRHDAALGLLGDDYPGLFAIGDTAQLAALMTRAESEPTFLHDLQERTDSLAAQFTPDRERSAWDTLLSELCPDRNETKDQEAPPLPDRTAR